MLICFVAYSLDYYHADSAASEVLNSSTSIYEEDQWIALDSSGEDIGFIFYPGAKVEYTAYLPLLEKVMEQGIDCYLVEMPFNLAILGQSRAEDVMEAHSEIDTWYIGGHSMGGAFAGNYASDHQGEISGVVLLGAYLYGEYPAEKTITIYGSEDMVLNREKINDDENVYVIEGGNHALFGNYGVQKGDGEAALTAEEQQEETVNLIMNFLEE